MRLQASMSADEFNALVKKGLGFNAGLKIAKARTAVEQRIRKTAPGSRRLMCLDLSMSKTGLAWGAAGQKPEGTVLLVMPATLKDQGEGQRLAAMADAITQTVLDQKCGFVIFGEFYNSKLMLSFRANAALRGAVMASLARHGIEALPIAEITARKAAGVDIRKRQVHEAKGYMKLRARAFLVREGLGHLSEDEGDAAIMLLGAQAVIQIGEP